MGGIRLRTKFLLCMVAVSAALTFTTLLVVRHTVQQEVRLGIQRDLENSVSAFHNFQKQREVMLERSAALLADLQNVRALMTTHDPATIQDASLDLWQLAGSDLLLLADSSGKVMALQAAPPEITVRQGCRTCCQAPRRDTGGTLKGTSTKFSSRIFISVQRAGTRFWDTCCWVTKLTTALPAT
jgi:hypothetical protein